MANYLLGTTERHLLKIIAHANVYGLWSQGFAQGYGPLSGSMLRKAYKAVSGRDMSIGQLYSTLDRLRDKGFLTYRESYEGEVEGWRKQRMYKVEFQGNQALKSADNMEKALERFFRYPEKG